MLFRDGTVSASVRGPKSVDITIDCLLWCSVRLINVFVAVQTQMSETRQPNRLQRNDFESSCSYTFYVLGFHLNAIRETLEAANVLEKRMSFNEWKEEERRREIDRRDAESKREMDEWIRKQSERRERIRDEVERVEAIRAAQEQLRQSKIQEEIDELNAFRSMQKRAIQRLPLASDDAVREVRAWTRLEPATPTANHDGNESDHEYIDLCTASGRNVLNKFE